MTTTSAAIGAAVAAEALAWINTPTVWNQSTKGRGTDCKGLLAGVARELELEEASSIYALEVSYREGRPVPVTRLKQGLRELFDVHPAGEPLRDGTVLLLKVGKPLRAQHLAIVVEGGTRAVHADGWTSKKVKSRDLALLLRACPLDSAFTWRARETVQSGD